MSEVEPGGMQFALVVLVFALPWLFVGAIVGAVVWHVVLRKRWWVGALAGAGLGAVTGFFAFLP